MILTTKRNRKLWRFAIMIFATFALVSCDKPDPFEDTDYGRNTLGFFLNGEKVEYSWTPRIPPAVYFKSVEAIEYTDTLEIWASLEKNRDRVEHIAIFLPLDQVRPGAVLDNVADIELTYLAGSEPIEDSVTRRYYGCLDIGSSRVTIRTYKQGELISGSFSFEGDAEFMAGSTRHWSITNGHFDVEIKKENHNLHYMEKGSD